MSDLELPEGFSAYGVVSAANALGGITFGRRHNAIGNERVPAYR